VYELSIKGHFDAAHYLTGYQGKCENLHGHRFDVVLTIRGESLDDVGLVYDFVKLKRLLGEVLSRFDHVLLNEVEPFTRLSPSSENVARAIYEEVESRLAGAPVSLARVQVNESPDAWAVYSR